MIQRTRFKNKFVYKIEADKDVMELVCLKLTLQPLVENAISHGIKPLDKEGIIRLKIHLGPRGLYISVLDNGVGIGTEELRMLKASLGNREEYGNHVGLINVHRRLVLSYGEEAGLHITSKKGYGTCVFFRLP